MKTLRFTDLNRLSGPGHSEDSNDEESPTKKHGLLPWATLRCAQSDRLTTVSLSVVRSYLYSVTGNLRDPGLHQDDKPTVSHYLSK